MADKQISSLPAATSVDDASLFVVEQQGAAMSASGALWKGYAIQAVQPYVNQVQEAADDAEAAAEKAAASATEASTAASGAQSAKTAAEAAKTAAETAQAAAEAAKGSAEASATAAAGSATAAAGSAEAAAGDAADAAGSATAAAGSADDAAASAEQAEQSATSAAGSAATAGQYSGKPPQIINDNWWVWNATTGEYEDTGERATIMYATFAIDPHTGILTMYAPDEYNAPVFSINANGYLEVSVNG